MILVEIIIACVSDEAAFPSGVYNYLLSELAKQNHLEEGRLIRVNPELITLDPIENEIHIDSSTNIPRGMVKWILQSFLDEDATKFKDYGVVEFGGAFMIGRILDPSKMEMYTCEICGFFTPYSEEIQTHRMTHFGI